MKKAIIGGTGVYALSQECMQKNIETPYGSVEVEIMSINGEEVIFLARHGKQHSFPPHLINYRANIYALKQLGVQFIYAICAVGSCNENYLPGDVVLMKDFIDFTKSRPMTFFEGGEKGVVHTDMRQPYCENLSNKLKEAALEKGLILKGEAVYVCTEGPRFETAHEINMYKLMGGDVVGMTNVPEVVLSKELGMCYSAAGIITNWCTGVHSEEIGLEDIKAAVDKNKKALSESFISAFTKLREDDSCSCREAVIRL